MNKYSKHDHTYARRWSKKIKAIEFLGGRCSSCGEKDVFVLEFHHTDEKENGINELLMRDAYWKDIKKELEKCVLLCGNCHFETHSRNDNTKELKIKLMEYKGASGCQICGHVSDNLTAIVFHHVGDKEIKITKAISNIVTKNGYGKFLETLIKEIDICEVICVNCHKKKHVMREKFEKLRELIDYKVNNLMDKKRVDRDNVYSLHENGFSQKEIARRMGCYQSCISKIIKNKIY